MSPERRTFISPSTRQFWKEGRQKPGFSFFDRLHGYIYGRWTYLYIGLGTGQHPLARRFGPLLARIAQRFVLWFGRKTDEKSAAANNAERVTFADTYHGKVMPLQAARELVLVQEEINLPDLEKVIPYTRAREIVLKNPDHIVVLDCPCRMARENPCLPMDVCLIVGEPFASFVMEYHPEHARWITPDEAVDILQAEDERGHVHHAFFKDAMLGRFYAICNCCACCCGAIQAHKNGTPMLASSGYLAQVDNDLCINCEACLAFCQFGALIPGDEYMKVDETACMGCGVCVPHCPQEALALVRSPEKGIPLEIHHLMEQAVNAHPLNPLE